MSSSVARTAKKRSHAAADERLTPYTPSTDFPPPEVGIDNAACACWYREVFVPKGLPAPDPSATARERQLYELSAEQYVALRREGGVTCEEYATALVKRARRCRWMNQWIYTSYERFFHLIEAARALDARASSEGVEAIQPLYGLPIPMKGTAAVVEYPSGSGSGVLSGYMPAKSSALTELIVAANGLIFGCTNVPEFAASYTTANPASGQTRNPYGAQLTVGGSSGGSASAVATRICPLAVTEDTGGSTRVPAACTQLWGFDPARNHYPNAGNPGMSLTNDQLGCVARSVGDIVLYDAALSKTAKLHADAAARAAARFAAKDVRVGAPLVPFVETRLGAGLHDSNEYAGLTLQPGLLAKLEAVRRALAAAKVTVVEQEWPSVHFDYLGREENVCTEALFCGKLVNGKNVSMLGANPNFGTFSGQLSTFVASYLSAPVSLIEVVDDMGCAGAGHHPAGLHKLAMADGFDETVMRWALGPKVASDVSAYNAYFDAHGVDLLLLPVARAAAPDLADLAGGTVPFPRLDGSTKEGSVMEAFNLHTFAFKHLHIPKLVVPTGLTEDGRPTAVQLWGRAVAYDDMFDDSKAAEHSVSFLHLARVVAEAMHAAAPELARADPEAMLP